MEYKTSWNLATIPDDALAKEWNRRRVVRQKGNNPGADARRKLEPCELCGESFSVSAMRSHLPQCKKDHPREALKLKQMKAKEREEREGNRPKNEAL
jgi:hypothetical protein